MKNQFSTALLGFFVSASLLADPNLTDGKACHFTFNPSTTKFEWTAFKFTEKTAVKGSFADIQVKNDRKQADSILSAMRPSQVTIPAIGIESGHPDRDQKIREYFLGTNPRVQEIKARFFNAKGNTEGTVDLQITWNGTIRKIPLRYTIRGAHLVAEGSLDVLDFGMSEGLQKLNSVCSELHKSKDGISKLWPTVDVRIESTFTSNCP